MKQQLEQYILDVITKKKKGGKAAFLRLLLLLMSWPFQLIVISRNWLFDHEWLRRYSPPVPVVISIGNIVAGGTGKTPVTFMMANEFYKEFLIAILARGYRSKSENLSNPTVLSHGEGPKRSADFCGDEPFLLAKAFPKAFVIVGRDRHKSSDIAARFGAQVVLLDDGMQHRRLARDFEVVVMDAFDLFGQGYFLPRGLLREGAKSLSRADLIIVNHVHDKKMFQETEKKLSCFTDAPMIATQFRVDQIQLVIGEPPPVLKECIENKNNSSFSQTDQKGGTISVKDLKVGIFCGIARPDHFYKTVIGEGAMVIDRVAISDHRRMEKKALHAFAHRCKEKGAELILCTEKDRVKLVNTEDLPLPIASVRTSLSIVEGEPEWHKFIKKIKIQLSDYGY